MALFSRRPAPPDGHGAASRANSRRYLASSPDAARTEVLASSLVLQVRELAWSAGDRFGSVVSPGELVATSSLVQRAMFQDRDVAAFVVRKLMHYEDVVFSDFMEIGRGVENLFTFLAAIGVRPSDADGKLEYIEPRSSTDPEGTLDDAVLAFVAYRGFKVGSEDPAAYAFYSELFTGSPGRDVEELAYGISALIAIAFGRLANSGRLRSGFITFTEEYRHIPVMHEAGWYPNPHNRGPIVNGEATLQRYWDGQWTDRMLVLFQGSWREDARSLHAPPTS